MNANIYHSLLDNLVTKISNNSGAVRGSMSKTISGIWTGTMYHANTSRKEEVVMKISTRFKPGKVCGVIVSKNSGSKFELILDTISGDVLSYSVSKSSSANDTAKEIGKLILRPDGTIYRVHQEQNSIVSGTLKRS
jgi:hypothetical protein